jgi:hypothetical protein
MPERDIRNTPVTHIGNEGSAEWVRDMQAYYALNGSYRVQDVQRVLGDPRTVVGFPTDHSLFAASLKK